MPPEIDEIVLPVLFQEARKTYVRAIRGRLADAGCEDLPPLGSRVLAVLNRWPESATDIGRVVGRTKQAASQLVDAMVLRGYLVRTPDPEDGRRQVLSLTERGVLAAREVRIAVEDTDDMLLAAVGSDDVAALRRCLVALLGPDPK